MTSIPPTLEVNEKSLQPPQEDQKDITPPSETEEGLEPRQQLGPRLTPIRWVFVCVGLFIGALLYGLDTTIAADVQASVYEDLGEIEKLPWIGIGFPMGSVAVILLIGKLYGTFDIKWLYITAAIAFEVGSALCGAAPTASALIVGRVIAGIGGAGIALTYISVFTTLHERALYNASIGLSWGVGAILGPVIAGAFSGSSATWRWAFYINLPLAAVTAPIYLWLFPRFDPQPTISVRQKIMQIDWVGAVLNAITFILIMIVIAFSGSSWRWSSGESIALWTITGVSLVLYALQQTFAVFTTTEHRLFPVHFTKNRTLVLIFCATAASSAAMAVTIYYVPLFFQFTRGDTALEAAVRLLPFITLFVFSVMVAGALLPVVGRYAPWYFPASILMIIGGVFMYRVKPDTHAGSIYGFEILIAVGVGLIFQTSYNIAAAKVDPVDVPASIGFVNVAQIGAMALALSICGALFQNVGFNYLTEALASYNFPENVLRSALAGVQSVVLHGEGLVVRNLAVDAIVRTIDKLYALAISAGALTFCCACLMSWEKLDLKQVG